MKWFRIHALLIAAACALATPGTGAATFSWSQVQLTGASGVPAGAKRGYVFKGIVEGYGKKSATDVSFKLAANPIDITSTSTNAVFATIWVQGKGHWDEQAKEAEETFVLDGDVKGQFFSRMKCTHDPWLGSSSCVVLSAQMAVTKGPNYDWPGMVKKAQLPLSSKAVDPILAAELSKKSGAGVPPPPPPATKVADKTLSKPGSASTMAISSPGGLASAGSGSGQPRLPAARGQQAFPKMERSAPTAAAPGWVAAEGRTSLGALSAPSMSAAARTEQTAAPAQPASSLTSVRASAAPAAATANVERDLAVASCTRTGVGGLRFSCTTPAGFDRCESFRKQHQVEQCTLALGR